MSASRQDNRGERRPEGASERPDGPAPEPQGLHEADCDRDGRRIRRPGRLRRRRRRRHRRGGQALGWRRLRRRLRRVQQRYAARPATRRHSHGSATAAGDDVRERRPLGDDLRPRRGAHRRRRQGGAPHVQRPVPRPAHPAPARRQASSHPGEPAADGTGQPARPRGRRDEPAHPRLARRSRHRGQRDADVHAGRPSRLVHLRPEEPGARDAVLVSPAHARAHRRAGLGRPARAPADRRPAGRPVRDHRL